MSAVPTTSLFSFRPLVRFMRQHNAYPIFSDDLGMKKVEGDTITIDFTYNFPNVEGSSNADR